MMEFGIWNQNSDLMITDRTSFREIYWLKFIILVGVVCLVSGCSTPSEKFAHYAEEQGLLTETVQTQLFEHQFFVNKLAQLSINRDELHVYLDGDGTPWRNHYRIADDPTSRNPLILELMQQDLTPSLMLGRPCYHQLKPLPECLSKYWTSHRYSTEIVNSMVKALNSWLQNHDYNKVILIGFSGGGALAVLMAPEVPKVSKVITIAANLDVAAWSRYHGFEPLDQSLNPAELDPYSQIEQIHLVGTDDEMVPPVTITKFIEKNDTALVIRYPGYEHLCCWADDWQGVLHKVLHPLLINNSYLLN